MKKLLKFAGILSSMCLAFYPYIVYDGNSFLFFGELPIPEDK